MKSIIISLILLFSIINVCDGGKTSGYVRKQWPTADMAKGSFPLPPGYNAPEQVHITQGDMEGRGMIISWLTPLKRYPNILTFWEDGYHISKSRVTRYTYFNYTSAFIHHATIQNLQYNTKYFYEIGTNGTARRFHFMTPPETGPDVPYTFGIIGDLGQTEDSNHTLEHYMGNKNGQSVLYVGDLSYADDHPYHDNERWDLWGRFVEKSVAYQPWIWTPGNHEIDYAPDIGERIPFKPYMHRYHVPYKASQSSSPLWYSLKRASAYIIVLSSYSAYGKYTPQYEWLKEELPKVKRRETPWLIVLLHCPWYNSNNYHYMEGESMRVAFEPWLVHYKVDLVLSGHVHSYERSGRVSNVRYNITNGLSMPVKDDSAPVYLTIGDGGNVEGVANNFSEPQPSYSIFREASFGHGILEIKNRTHAFYTWHRNEDTKPVAADTAWFYNRYFFPHEEPHTTHV